MNLAEILNNYIHNPFPLWECEVTGELVLQKWNELKELGINEPNEYSTQLFIDGSSSLAERFPLYSKDKRNTIFLEVPPVNSIAAFYEKHGLSPFSPEEIETTAALFKIQRALEILDLVPMASQCISQLVRTIQVLKPSGPETDTSYSSPHIPFTIFVSVCEDDSPISNLRVAESILHEAMHLKLTLIENTLTLIKPNSTATHYSPWRNEERPIRGVLHGLFVFRAILDLYNEIVKIYRDKTEATKFLVRRKANIKKEIDLLKGFSEMHSLALSGKTLVDKLLR